MCTALGWGINLILQKSNLKILLPKILNKNSYSNCAAIYSCALEVYSTILIFCLKDWAHLDPNIWPLSTWHGFKLVMLSVVSGLTLEVFSERQPRLLTVFVRLSWPLCGYEGLPVHLFVQSLEAPSKRGKAIYLTGKTRNQENTVDPQGPLHGLFYFLDSLILLG